MDSTRRCQNNVSVSASRHLWIALVVFLFPFYHRVCIFHFLFADFSKSIAQKLRTIVSPQHMELMWNMYNRASGSGCLRFIGEKPWRYIFWWMRPGICRSHSLPIWVGASGHLRIAPYVKESSNNMCHASRTTNVVGHRCLTHVGRGLVDDGVLSLNLVNASRQL